MSIATEITRLQNAKASIKSSIENKGVTVPSATKLDGYSTLIDSIQTGITPTGTISITSNGTVDVTNYASANVNVSGSGWDPNQYAEGLVPVGELTLNTATKINNYAFAYKTSITRVIAPNVLTINGSAFEGCSGLLSFSLPNATIGASQTRAFFGCNKLTVAVLPSLTGETMGSTFQNCTLLASADFGPSTTKVSNNTFNNSPAMRALILRGSSVVALGSWNVGCLGGIYSNPSASTIYVPSALISSYETATNWSSAYSAGVTFSSIENSIYASQYADGTSIGA